MPTVSVDKAALFKELGRDFTTQEFDELCFEFGIELDEDTTDSQRPVVDGVQEAPQLKIDIPANRYDMLCFEGIALNLNVFMQNKNHLELPKFSLKPSSPQQSIKVHPETTKIRPLVSGAILRNVEFNQARYDSFIALQDKLHQNLARQRTLVSIGTHDLDKIKGPFTYEALPPKDIKFVPLKMSEELAALSKTRDINAEDIMKSYEKDKYLSKYLHIIRDSPVYPVILDANRSVCSMPPVINSDRSRIDLKTRNVFIDVTATDKTKLEVVTNILVTMFSKYCGDKYTVEPVKIESDHNNQTRLVPQLDPRETQAEVKYLNSCCGLSLSPMELCERLKRMGYSASPSSEQDKLKIMVPPTRADVLHQADIMEDVAISYGFNNLPRPFPARAATIAAPLPINKLADIVRLEAAMAGWSEVLPLILCSHEENFAWLNRIDDGNTAIRLQNPKTSEYQIVRTSLIPGLLKCIRENKHHRVPIRVFETSDVAFKDSSKERKSRNERHFAAAWYGKTSGFEMVHGLLDRVMLMLKSAFLTRDEAVGAGRVDGYWIEELQDPTYLAGHAASIHVKNGDKRIVVGSFGVLHPTVLKNFELPYPVSTLEINLEPFL